ncbi:MAG: beta-galactosidase [Pseudomonadota bacterium]
MSAPKTPRLGVCYFPEHWPEETWRDDAREMAALGIRQVRLGEFAWSRIEPAPGRFDWGWLDRAIDVLAEAGHDLMLCTPTATPPKWLVDAHPDILAVDAEGRPRRFGSRRHYCFSSPRYREETRRIVEAIADRYGRHDAIQSWQIDNEFGCHESVRSYSAAAADAFRDWLRARYGEVKALNDAWGTVFWSQEYRTFEEVDPPNLTVTEPNPSHVLDYYRFSSDQVISYNRLQADILRDASPGRDITHNVMGFYFEFDHFALGADLDFVSWDSYPMGFLDVGPFPEDAKKRYMRQGHPDIAAFHHDLYRVCGRGRWQVIEQQPGPVNWAHANPAPAPGVVRLWASEAAAHGAEAVSYFRWRQAPFAQEQMHAGLKRSDDAPALGYEEARAAAQDFAALAKSPARGSARVALLFDYETQWLFEAHPHGRAWSYPKLVFEWYSALRQCGFVIDVIGAHTDFTAYDLLLAPSLPILGDDLASRLTSSGAQIVLGPRTGSKTIDLHAETRPGQGLSALLPVRLSHVESFSSAHQEAGDWNGTAIAGRDWLDHVETSLTPLATSDGGAGLLYRNRDIWWTPTVPCPVFLGALVVNAAVAAGLSPSLMPEGLRVARADDMTVLVNYDLAPAAAPQAVREALGVWLGEPIIGGHPVAGPGFSVWKANRG